MFKCIANNFEWFYGNPLIASMLNLLLM